MRAMLGIQIENWALGLAIDGHGDVRRFAHGGAQVGFRCYLVGYCDQGHGAIVMTMGNAEIISASRSCTVLPALTTGPRITTSLITPFEAWSEVFAQARIMKRDEVLVEKQRSSRMMAMRSA